jgi:hypothetical protein
VEPVGCDVRWTVTFCCENNKFILVIAIYERHNTYNLRNRNRNTDLSPPMPKKEFGKRRFNYNGALHWNNLPHEAKIAESLSSFTSILKQRMS